MPQSASSVSNPVILQRLFDTLWSTYCQRVSYARKYAELVTSLGGTVQNDHIALRTLNCPTGAQPAGIPAMLRLFEPLGYAVRGNYEFKDKHLNAVHLEHLENPNLPKVFISQLEVNRLSAEAQSLIQKNVEGAKDPLSAEVLTLLNQAKDKKSVPVDVANRLVKGLAACFTRPWQPPFKDAVVSLNKESQYGAWTLIHGNAVNHFTAYLNAQNVPKWGDIEGTVAALRKEGIPMKTEIEGERGTKLRQSSTEAVNIPCEARTAEGKVIPIEWSYAYYELAERNPIPGPDGKPFLYQGFLGAQATNLFEMTRVKKS